MIRTGSGGSALVFLLTLNACETGDQSPGTDSPGTSPSTSLTAGSSGTGTSNTGATGSAGNTGATSHSGATGNAGTSDTTGSSGNSGATNNTGATGGNTTNGATNSAATTGVTGADGTTADVFSASNDPSSTDTAENSGATSSSEGESSDSPSDDPCEDSVFCDDFDDDTVGMAPGQPWTADVNGGAVEVSSERAFSGDRSVHISNTAGAYKRAYMSITGAPVFPSAGAEMYGRMMMWLDVAPRDGVHWTFIQGEGDAEADSYRIFYRYGGQHQGKMMANFETEGVSSDCWSHSATVTPTKTWSCLEWRFNTTTDEMQFWLDGTEVTDLHIQGQGNAGTGCVNSGWTQGWPAPGAFDALRLGLEKYQDDGVLDMWVDDVAVSTTRVGCPVID